MSLILKTLHPTERRYVVTAYLLYAVIGMGLGVFWFRQWGTRCFFIAQCPNIFWEFGLYVVLGLKPN